MSSGVLVGRDNDLAAVVDAHRSKDIDLVVVVGAAGVGKSHLAAAVLDSVARIGAPIKRALCTAPLQQVPFARSTRPAR